MKLFLDTTPEALEVYFDGLRRMSVDERIGLASAACEQARIWAMDGVRRRHPDYSESEVELAAARLRLGEEVFKRFFPDCKLLP